MRIIIVTHAETRGEAPRLLSDVGKDGIKEIAGLIRVVMGEEFRLEKAVSSPAVRCIETALLIMDEIAGDKLRRLDTDPRLMAANEPMEPEQLHRALSDYGCDGLLVIMHADLANALPEKEGIKNSDIVKEGWFQARPVLALLDWKPDRLWKENRTISLMGLDGKSLLPEKEVKEKTPLLH